MTRSSITYPVLIAILFVANVLLFQLAATLLVYAFTL